MRLIIREYLASLKERNELDAILPDLLAQMGLNVFSKPSIGTRQYGVDVAAYGSLNRKKKGVYLFSIKQGDIGRDDWDGPSQQSLRRSLNEILDTYIPSSLPIEYKSEPIVICICLGGKIKEEVRQSITGYENRKSSEGISFQEWNGDLLAEYIERYLLKEELLPLEYRSHLRKALAMLDEPDVSFRHFAQLVDHLSASGSRKPKNILTALRQLYLCLWILYAWGRDANNIESAYLSSEFVLLRGWEICKISFLGKNKNAESLSKLLLSIQSLYVKISDDYCKKIIPYVNNIHALSQAVRSSSPVDANLKLFDVLGRMALLGFWKQWAWDSFSKSGDSETTEKLSIAIAEHQIVLRQLIFQNPILFTPYKDDQAIDITLAGYFLLLDSNNHSYIYEWFYHMTNLIYYLFHHNGQYPCTLNQYHELIEHPISNDDHYRNEVTQSSILYPMISLFSAMLNFDDVYAYIQKLKSKFLSECNFQIWHPDASSEQHFYINDDLHGATLPDISIDKEKALFLEEVFKECDETSYFDELSAVKKGMWPIILVACRHYRYPIPVHFLKNVISPQK